MSKNEPSAPPARPASGTTTARSPPISAAPTPATPSPPASRGPSSASRPAPAWKSPSPPPSPPTGATSGNPRSSSTGASFSGATNATGSAKSFSDNTAGRPPSSVPRYAHTRIAPPLGGNVFGAVLIYPHTPKRRSSMNTPDTPTHEHTLLPPHAGGDPDPRRVHGRARSTG